MATQENQAKILILATEDCAYPGANAVGQAHMSYPENSYVMRVRAPVMFPEQFYLDCASCITTPKMSAAAHHPNVTSFTYCELQSLKRTGCEITALVTQKPRFVDGRVLERQRHFSILNRNTECGS